MGDLIDDFWTQADRNGTPTLLDARLKKILDRYHQGTLSQQETLEKLKKTIADFKKAHSMKPKDPYNHARR